MNKILSEKAQFELPQAENVSNLLSPTNQVLSSSDSIEMAAAAIAPTEAEKKYLPRKILLPAVQIDLRPENIKGLPQPLARQNILQFYLNPEKARIIHNELYYANGLNPICQLTDQEVQLLSKFFKSPNPPQITLKNGRAGRRAT